MLGEVDSCRAPASWPAPAARVLGPMSGVGVSRVGTEMSRIEGGSLRRLVVGVEEFLVELAAGWAGVDAEFLGEDLSQVFVGA